MKRPAVDLKFTVTVDDSGLITPADQRFYDDERLRWPELHGVPLSNTGARRAVILLTEGFKLERVPLKFIKGDISWGGCDGIELAESRDWLVLAHEFAHVLDCAKRGHTLHDKAMALIVDEVCAVVTRAPWVQDDLDAQVDAYEAKVRRAVVYAKRAAPHR